MCSSLFAGIEGVEVLPQLQVTVISVIGVSFGFHRCRLWVQPRCGCAALCCRGVNVTRKGLDRQARSMPFTAVREQQDLGAEAWNLG